MATEIELKFRIPAARLAALRRAVATARAVREPLAAVYFDTPGEDLARARVALRLRREGARWVQTLKAEGASAMHRLEHNAALDDAGDQPPPLDLARHAGSAAGQALQQLLAAAGDPPLRPRYATDVQRTRRVLHTGGARIELALDEGELRSGEARLPIREIEFELLDGPLDALLALAGRWAARFDLVLDVRSKSERGHLLASGRAASPPARARPQPGPVPATPAAAVAAMLAAALRPALANASVLADPDTAAAVAGDPEYLHQLRVALRRLRSLLRLWGPLAPGGAAALAPALATLFGALGGARDDDVLRTALQPALQAAGAPPLAWPPAAGAQDGVGAALAAPATQRLWLGLLGACHALPDAGRGEPAEVGQASDALREALRPALRRLWRQVRREAAHPAALDDDARHRLRRRIKRLRYGTEFSAALWPARRVAGLLAALQAAQDALGEDHDALYAQQRCRALAAAEPTAWFAVGWLAARRQALAPAWAAALAELAAQRAPWRRPAARRRRGRRG